MEQSDLPSTLRLRGAPSEDVPEIMQNFRLYVNMNTAYGVSDEVVDRCAVKCLPLLVRGTAANRMQQLQSGTLEWRTQKELAKLDPDGAGVGILAPVLWGEWVNAFTQLFSPDNLMELLARSIVTIKQETDESVMVYSLRVNKAFSRLLAEAIRIGPANTSPYCYAFGKLRTASFEEGLLPRAAQDTYSNKKHKR